MKDKDVVKIMGKILDKVIDKQASSRPGIPDFSSMRQMRQTGKKPKKKPTKSQLKELEKGRKILQMNRRESNNLK